MSEEKSHTEVMAELRTQVAAIHTDDTERRTRLDAFAASLDDNDEPETLTERLNEALLQFEADHPEIAPAIHRVLAILGTGGI